MGNGEPDASSLNYDFDTFHSCDSEPLHVYLYKARREKNVGQPQEATIIILARKLFSYRVRCSKLQSGVNLYIYLLPGISLPHASRFNLQHH